MASEERRAPADPSGAGCVRGRADDVCVLNLQTCPHSRTQLETLKALRCADDAAAPPLAVIDCGDRRNRDVPLCHDVKAFPAFCNKAQGRCVYGLRTTVGDVRRALDGE